MRSGIYKIVNKINNKTYIGSAINLRHRWTDHRKHLRSGTHHSSHLQSAWNKYGEENFVFKIIRVIHHKEMLIPNEQIHMDLCESYKRENGYNMCPKAGSSLGTKHPNRKPVSDIQKRKISIALTGRKLSEEHINNMRKSMTGKKHKHESILKMKRNCFRSYGNKHNLGRHPTNETRLKLSRNNPMRGGNFSVEHRRKIGEANKTRFVSEDTKRKISENNAMKGKHLSEHVKLVLSSINTGWKNPMLLKSFKTIIREWS